MGGGIAFPEDCQEPVPLGLRCVILYQEGMNDRKEERLFNGDNDIEGAGR